MKLSTDSMTDMVDPWSALSLLLDADFNGNKLHSSHCSKNEMTS